jgi:hypothetical protein
MKKALDWARSKAELAQAGQNPSRQPIAPPPSLLQLKTS